MAESGIKGYHILQTNSKKTPIYDTDETTEKYVSSPKLLNFTGLK